MNAGQAKCRIAVALCAISSGVVLANPGDFDSTFNGVGFARDFVPGLRDRSDLTVQLSGEIVTIMKADSGPALWRHLSDGTLDTSFGGTGTVLPPKLACVAGTLRLDDRGSLDPTFGVGGMALTDLGGLSSNAEDVALQSDGNILVGGGVTYNDTRGVSNAVILRYLPDGNLDASFGEGGISETNYGYYSNGVFKVAIQADGRIVAGAATGGPAPEAAVAARYQQ